MEKFDENTQRMKVAKGLKGGPFNAPRAATPSLRFADGVAPTTKEKLNAGKEATGQVSDPWYGRKKK